MDSEPIIGISAVREPARWSFWHQTAHLVADAYVAAVQRTGALAVILPVDRRGPLDRIDLIDALLVIGGADVDPASYGAQGEEALEETYPERDDFELALVRAAAERDLPLLGICRGMHILNVAFGGTLVQDLAVARGSNPHRRALGTFEGTEHVIRLDPGSLAASAVGEEAHIARCHHHQGVAQLGEGLRVTGRDEVDGLVEAIEVDDARWMLGVQWHPEADERSRLFAALADAARDRSSRTRGRRSGAAEPALSRSEHDS
jgi:putative glutamine amidotransferase